MTTTSQRPTFGVRIAALLIDYAIILGWMAVLAGATLLSFAVTGEFFNWLLLGTAGAQILGFLLLVLPVGLYLYFSESSAHQATVGKRRFRLRVFAASDHARTSRSRVLVRTIVKLLPWEIAHFAVWNIRRSRRHRGLRLPDLASHHSDRGGHPADRLHRGGRRAERSTWTP
ncbi:MAG: RDD family protein [Propioniciclava sp.]